MVKRTLVVSERLTQRVNELFHDFTREQYEYRHPEIIEQERERWERLANRFLNFTNYITIVDIGTGTGFVPLTIANSLREGDTFVCSDISKGILEVAKRNITAQDLKCRFEFVKLEGNVPFRLPFDTRSIDVMTMNSVLHHIKDTDTFLKEVDRSLKPEGLLFIGHEPNKRFYKHRFLHYNYLILSLISNPMPFVVSVIDKIGKRTHTSNILRRIYHLLCPAQRKEYEIWRRIYGIVLNEGLVTENLLVSDIPRIVDIRDKEGFEPESLFPRYDLLNIETYNHLSWVGIKHHGSRLLSKYENWLQTKFPKCGVTFFIVLRKGRG